MAAAPSQRQLARIRLARAARMTALLDDLGTAPWDQIGNDIGIPPKTVRGLFRDADDLLDELNDQLVEEVAVRLSFIDASVLGAHDEPEQAIDALAREVARARPLERSSLMVRLSRRTLALRRPSASAARAEARFLRVLQGELTRLLQVIGREPSLPADDMTRALLNSYERAFEAWLASGKEETDFAESRFATQALPRLMGALSRPSSIAD